MTMAVVSSTGAQFPPSPISRPPSPGTVDGELISEAHNKPRLHHQHGQQQVLFRQLVHQTGPQQRYESSHELPQFLQPEPTPPEQPILPLMPALPSMQLMRPGSLRRGTALYMDDTYSPRTVTVSPASSTINSDDEYSPTTTTFPKSRNHGGEITNEEIRQRHTTESWPEHWDYQLRLCRRRGMSWKKIAEENASLFKHKTANACRKRYERIKDKMALQDLGVAGKRLDEFAVAYLAARKDMWMRLAKELDVTKWQDLEAKFLEVGLGQLKSENRKAQRMAMEERGMHNLYADPRSTPYHGVPEHGLSASRMNSRLELAPIDRYSNHHHHSAAVGRGLPPLPPPIPSLRSTSGPSSSKLPNPSHGGPERRSSGSRRERRLSPY